MRVKTLKSLVLYNYRYFFAYLTVALFGLYFLAWRLGSLPSGLSFQELQSAANNVQFSTFFSNPIYPLHGLLQWLSLQLFGIGAISIRLPNSIIAVATALLLYTLLKKWFGKVTSLLAIAFILSADWFLFIARSGVGVIEFSFWLTLILLSFTKLVENKPRWLAVYGLSTAFMLFSPFGIYAVLTSTICLFTCAMFRKRANEAPVYAKVAFGVLPVVALAILTWLSVKDINFLRTLLGTATLPTPFEFFKNMVMNASSSVMIWPDNNPLLGPNGIFLIRFVEFTFMLFGLIMLVVTRVNRLNIVVIANAIALAIVSGLSSSAYSGGLLIVPAAIFFTCGLRHFIHRWQRTFPKNPYARVALYIPLSIMLISATVLHFQSYFVLWPRQSMTARVFTPDYALLKSALNNKEGSCTVIGAEKSVETLIMAKNYNCQPVFANQLADVALTSGEHIIVHGKKLPVKKFENITPLTSGTQQDNIRWVVADVVQ